MPLLTSAQWEAVVLVLLLHPEWILDGRKRGLGNGRENT
jgi:hypothetical protein